MIATAAWSRSQLQQVGLKLPVYPHRAEMAFFHVPLEKELRLIRILSDTRSQLYLRPEGRLQMFVGWREGDLVRQPEDCVPENPDDYRETVHFDRLVQMHNRLSQTLPFMARGFANRSYACVYDYTPDGQPILDAAGSTGLYSAIGFSGGGFSTAPCVGRTMAKFIASGKKPQEIEWLRLSRFAEGDLIHWNNLGLLQNTTNGVSTGLR